MKNIKKN